MKEVESSHGDEQEAPPALTRRERQRQTTVDEIVEVGRSLLRSDREVTLRAVAAEMGFTAPALYRYVDSAAALNDLLSNRIFVDVVAEMAAASARYGDDDAAAQMVAAATAFRAWALEDRAEFQLVFATTSLSGERTTRPEGGRPHHPIMGADGGGPAGVPPAGVEMFADFFGGIFARLARQRPFPVPGHEELDPAFVAVYDPAEEGRPDVTALLGADALGMIWLFELAWAQLYGIITLEVFGHVRPQLIKSGVLFRAVMREVGARAGMAEDWDRLAAVSEEVLARRVQRDSA